MSFWWVNQNQTYKEEVGGGYMWSPKKNKNGAYNQFYENMTLAQSGDIVFSFRNQKISDLGVVQSRALSAVKPGEFGNRGENWSDEGWKVPVTWYPLETPVKPKDHIQELKPTLPEKYSPLSLETGNGLQSVYLASVPDSMASILLDKMSANDRSLVENENQSLLDQREFIDAQENEKEQEIQQDTTIDSTEKEALVKARKGQGRYRRNLELIEQTCRVTGVSDKRLLRASHIKPWRYCHDNHERLDGNNGLLLTPNIDLLFDQGYITFTDSGEMHVSPVIPAEQLNAMGISGPKKINVGGFNQKQIQYLAYHRKYVFRS